MQTKRTARDNRTHIIGAGPAGLCAAIAIATAGREVVVHDRRPDVGRRFHGDFEGLENWTAREVVIEVHLQHPEKGAWED